MPPETVEGLAEYPKRRVGDDLRGVVFYGEGECDVVFVREDVAGTGSTRTSSA